MEPADTWIGRAMRRREDPRLVTGRGCYAADNRPDGLVHMAVGLLPNARHSRTGISGHASDPVWKYLAYRRSRVWTANRS